MANLSDLTRKELVLRYLQQHANQWVDGPELANEKVGGSEGLRRIRELREKDGHRIVTRPHPDRTRDIFQYKLVPPESVHPVVQERLGDMLAAQAPSGTGVTSQATPATPPEPPPPSVSPGMASRQFLMRKTEDGLFELTKEVCVDCGGLYDDDLEHRTTDVKHLRWAEQEQKRSHGQLTIGVPEQPPPYKFTKMPDRLDMSKMALCPRCHGRRRMQRKYFSRKKGDYVETPAEDFTRDPFKPTVKGEPNPCQRCDGIGFVPTHVQEVDGAVQQLPDRDPTPPST